MSSGAIIAGQPVPAVAVRTLGQASCCHPARHRCRRWGLQAYRRRRRLSPFAWSGMASRPAVVAPVGHAVAVAVAVCRAAALRGGGATSTALHAGQREVAVERAGFGVARQHDVAVGLDHEAGGDVGGANGTVCLPSPENPVSSDRRCCSGRPRSRSPWSARRSSCDDDPAVGLHRYAVCDLDVAREVGDLLAVTRKTGVERAVGVVAREGKVACAGVVGARDQDLAVAPGPPRRQRRRRRRSRSSACRPVPRSSSRASRRSCSGRARSRFPREAPQSGDHDLLVRRLDCDGMGLVDAVAEVRRLLAVPVQRELRIELSGGVYWTILKSPRSLSPVTPTATMSLSSWIATSKGTEPLPAGLGETLDVVQPTVLKPRSSMRFPSRRATPKPPAPPPCAPPSQPAVRPAGPRCRGRSRRCRP